MPELIPSACAICETFGNAEELYEQRLPPDAFSSVTFSARRRPDRVHYRIVKCNRCGLWRSDPVARWEDVRSLYESSGVSYGRIERDIASTYTAYLERLQEFRLERKSLLEIGCGSGFVLQAALAHGYELVRGIEPSRAAIESAPTSIRAFISQGDLHPEILPASSFDVACMFQVLDHLPMPQETLRAIHGLLKPGGLLLVFNHDCESWTARLLRERSPIVDVEHTYLFSKRTISTLLQTCGYDVLAVASGWNRYPLAYLAHLLPRPDSLDRLPSWLERLRIGNLRVTLPLGNLYAVGRRPEVTR